MAATGQRCIFKTLLWLCVYKAFILTSVICSTGDRLVINRLIVNTHNLKTFKTILAKKSHIPFQYCHCLGKSCKEKKKVKIEAIIIKNKTLGFVALFVFQAMVLIFISLHFHYSFDSYVPVVISVVKNTALLVSYIFPRNGVSINYCECSNP